MSPYKGAPAAAAAYNYGSLRLDTNLSKELESRERSDSYSAFRAPHGDTSSTNKVVRLSSSRKRGLGVDAGHHAGSLPTTQLSQPELTMPETQTASIRDGLGPRKYSNIMIQEYYDDNAQNEYIIGNN